MISRFCIVVPHYQHHRQLPLVLAELRECALPTVVVDDGSDAESTAVLRSLAERHDFVQIEYLPENLGKGAAVVHGLLMAAKQGFTHAIQIDADGQHEIADIGKLQAASLAHPDAIVSGLPVFGADIPKSRLHGRKITTFFVMIETLSRDIRDAMCGFRVYPIKPLLALCDAARIRPRMQFDTEVLVRWHWRGGRVHFVKTRVRYPPDGVSHFRLIGDNVDISLMHTRLILGMLARLPRLLISRARRPVADRT